MDRKIWMNEITRKNNISIEFYKLDLFLLPEFSQIVVCKMPEFVRTIQF